MESLLLILSSNVFKNFGIKNKEEYFGTIEIPIVFQENVKNLFLNEEEKNFRVKVHVFWEKNDLLNKNGQPFSSLFYDILSLFNEVLLVTLYLCQPQFNIFQNFINNILETIVKNVVLKNLNQMLRHKTLESINHNYDLISKELEQRNKDSIHHSEISKSVDKNEKEMTENPKNELLKSGGLEEQKKEDNIEVKIQENQVQMSNHIENLDPLILKKNCDSEIIVQNNPLEKSTQSNEPQKIEGLSKTMDLSTSKDGVLLASQEESKKFETKALLKSEESKSSDMQSSLGASLKPSISSSIKITFLSSPKLYSLEYLDEFNIDFFQHQPQEAPAKNWNYSTIMDYICSIYCLKSKFSDENCCKISTKLKLLDGKSFTKLCNLNAKKNWKRINLLQNFFSELNTKVWDIYQLEKNIDDLEEERKNEILPVCGKIEFQEI